MKTFSDFLSESTSIESDQLGHLTHAKDIEHESPEHHMLGHDLIRQFHNARQGKASPIRATLKTDGGASVHIIHDEKGVAVSDKHRFKRGVIARTPEEVDQHFGHAPGYAAALKHVLAHGHEIVNRGHHVQGDLLHTPAEPGKKRGENTSMTPNRITYKAKTTAPLGIAIHTEVKNGKAKALSKGATKKSPNIFTPEHELHHDPSTYSEADRQATEHHLNAAKALLTNHTSAHLTPEHQQHFTIYANRTTRRGETPSVEGYKKHLAAEGEKAAKKLKSPAGQQRARDLFAGHVAHVDKHAQHFQRSIDIRHHLEQATEHVLKGVKHPDMETSIDGKKSQGEGVVLQKNDRPIAKLVPKKSSYEILNNTRFKKPE
jgi:hypothetical protein